MKFLSPDLPETALWRNLLSSSTVLTTIHHPVVLLRILYTYKVCQCAFNNAHLINDIGCIYCTVQSVFQLCCMSVCVCVVSWGNLRSSQDGKTRLISRHVCGEVWLCDPCKMSHFYSDMQRSFQSPASNSKLCVCQLWRMVSFVLENVFLCLEMKQSVDLCR